METESDTPNETGQAPETELGARLTRARDEQELSLEKATASLKVDVAVLNNLETENFVKPGMRDLLHWTTTVEEALAIAHGKN